MTVNRGGPESEEIMSRAETQGAETKLAKVGKEEGRR